MSKKFWKFLCIFICILFVGSNAYWVVTRPKPVTLNFAYQTGFHYGPSIIMDEFDLIEKNSYGRYKGSYFLITGGTVINEAIVAGSIDFAQMGTAPAITAVDKGMGTKILASFGAKEHELWTWREDIQSIADFKEGDIVSAVALNSIEHVGLIKAYADIGKTAEEATAISRFFSPADAYQMMEEGTIDAHFASVPYTLEYAKDPRYHMIATDSSIWGMSLAGGALMGKTEDPEVADIVLQSFKEAIDWIEANPEEASRIIGKVFKYDEAKAWELWQASGITWGAEIGLGSIKTQADVMYDIGLLSRELTQEELLFPQAIQMIEE